MLIHILRSLFGRTNELFSSYISRIQCGSILCDLKRHFQWFRSLCKAADKVYKKASVWIQDHISSNFLNFMYYSFRHTVRKQCFYKHRLDFNWIWLKTWNFFILGDRLSLWQFYFYMDLLHFSRYSWSSSVNKTSVCKSACIFWLTS